jgi:MoxR-like ATPase
MMSSYLPTAHVAFLDEIWKSSSAILNTLLTILNEHTVRDDGRHVPIPLRLCIAASNEWPNDQEGGKDLQAIFDRFLFRKLVRPIGTTRGMERLLWGTLSPPQTSVQVDDSELDQARVESRQLPWAEPTKEAYREIIHRARKEGIVPGDRRRQQAAEAVAAYAWLNEASEIETDHLEILEHVLWEDPAEQPKKLVSIINEVAAPIGMKINQLQLDAEEIISSSDMKDLAKASVCDRKLGSIEKSLSTMGPRADSVKDFVKQERARLRRAAFQGTTDAT